MSAYKYTLATYIDAEESISLYGLYKQMGNSVSRYWPKGIIFQNNSLTEIVKFLARNYKIELNNVKIYVDYDIDVKPIPSHADIIYPYRAIDITSDSIERIGIRHEPVFPGLKYDESAENLANFYQWRNDYREGLINDNN